jgi:hypothetical protein
MTRPIVSLAPMRRGWRIHCWACGWRYSDRSLLKAEARAMADQHRRLAHGEAS